MRSKRQDRRQERCDVPAHAACRVQEAVCADRQVRNRKPQDDSGEEQQVLERTHASPSPPASPAERLSS